MPGSFTSFFIAAFDLDDKGQAIPASKPRLAPTEDAAITAAQELAQRHAGVLVWKRVGDPVVGEEGEPVVVYRQGTTGDFD